MARPKIQIDEKLVAALAEIHCTMNEIAAVVGCSVDTLERRFAETIKASRDRGRASLRRWQVQLAAKGNATMLIWLGKQLLEQKDQSKLEVDDKRLAQLSEKELIQEMNQELEARGLKVIETGKSECKD